MFDPSASIIYTWGWPDLPDMNAIWRPSGLYEGEVLSVPLPTVILFGGLESMLAKIRSVPFPVPCAYRMPLPSGW